MVWLILLTPFMILLGIGIFIDLRNKSFKKKNPALTENQSRAKEDIERYKNMNRHNL